MGVVIGPDTIEVVIAADHLGLDRVRVEVEHGAREGDGLRLVCVYVIAVFQKHGSPLLYSAARAGQFDVVRVCSGELRIE